MENLSVWQQYKQGSSQAKNQIVEKYSYLVKVIVGRLCVGDKFGQLDKEDLYSWGIVGLLEAIDRFDPSLGIKFETFATTRVRGQVIDSIRKANWIPKDIKSSIKELELAYQELAASNLPIIDENIMKLLNINEQRLKKIMNYSSQSNLIYLDNLMHLDNESEKIVDNIPDHTQVDPLDELILNQATEQLTIAIKKLTEKEQLVLSLYYFEELTLKEISRILNLSEARISQIHSKSIFRLRGFLNKYRKKSS